MHILIIGEVSYGDDGELQLAAAKVSDLSGDPDSFSMWLCEVIDAKLQLAQHSASANGAGLL